MIRAIAVLLFCQLVGEILTRALNLPVPGPVIGLALLAVAAIIHARATGADAAAIETSDLGRVATALIGAFGLLFVPAGVGIVQQLSLFGTYGLAIFVTLFISTALTLIVSVYVFIFVARALARRQGGIKEG